MTPEKQRIAIATAVAWKPSEICKDFNGNIFPQEPPNYPYDLNAMHEAEKTLDKRDFATYAYSLYLLPDVYGYIRATAAQRAEAFLKTLGLWKESDDKD